MTTFVIDTSVLLPLLHGTDARLTSFLAATYLRTDLEFLITEAVLLDFDDDKNLERKQVHFNLIRGVKTIPTPRTVNRSALTSEWLKILFPRCQRGSHNYEHNSKDSLHVGLAVRYRADFFVTSDERLQRKSTVPQLGKLQIINIDNMFEQIELTKGRQANSQWENCIKKHTGYIRLYQPADRRQVEAIGLHLEPYYPHIMSWLDKELDGLDRATDFSESEDDSRHLLLVDIDGALVGCALYSHDGAENVTLGMFYVLAEYRELGVDSHLLYYLIQQWIREGAMCAKFSFAYEALGKLAPLFQHYGFEVVGFSPEAHRTGTCELVCQKRFLRMTVDVQQFERLVLERYLGSLPIQIEQTNVDTYSTFNCLTGRKTNVRVSVIRGARPPDDASQIICMIPTDGKDPQTVDGLALERMFFPLELRWPSRRPFLIPVQTRFAKQLFPSFQDHLSLFGPTKAFLMPDNVYFKSPDRRIRRGDPVVFYVTGTSGHLIGEAVVTEVETGPPTHIFQKYHTIGVAREEEVKSWSAKNRVMAFRFDFFRSYRNGRDMDYQYLRRKLPKINVQTYYRIPYNILDDIRKDGGIL